MHFACFAKASIPIKKGHAHCVGFFENSCGERELFFAVDESCKCWHAPTARSPLIWSLTDRFSQESISRQRKSVDTQRFRARRLREASPCIETQLMYLRRQHPETFVPFELIEGELCRSFSDPPLVRSCLASGGDLGRISVGGLCNETAGTCTAFSASLIQ